MEGGQRDDAAVRSFRPVAALDDDGAVSGLLLWYRSMDGPGRWLECDVAALRAGLDAAPTAPIVGFFPDDVSIPDVADLVSAASAALSTASVVAPLAPVTDAVKLVDGRRLVRSVDRSSLHRVHGPAFARTDVVRQVVQDVPSGTIRPLVAAAAASRLQIMRLIPSGIAS